MTLIRPRRRIHILFPFEWIAYATPLHNLVEALTSDFDVTVLSVGSGEFCGGSLDPKIYRTVTVDKRRIGLPARMFTTLLNRWTRPHSRFHAHQIGAIFRLISEIVQRRPDIVIATDSLGLFLASQVFQPVIYYSLELCRDEFMALSDMKAISCVVTQSEERRRYLFGDMSVETYCLPNAPRFVRRPAPLPSRRIIYFGNIVETHGLALLPEALRLLDPAFTLTLCGMIQPDARRFLNEKHRDLIESGRLIISDQYVDPAEVTDHLAKFAIGLCFYDIGALLRRLFNESTDFVRPAVDDRELRLLYTTTKLHNYAAAGVPVVGLDIGCMRIVRDYESGVLVDELTPQSVADAVRKIECDRDRYVEGSFRAAEACNFDVHVRPFLHFLSTERSMTHQKVTSPLRAQLQLAARLVTSLHKRRMHRDASIRQRLELIKRDLGRTPVLLYGAGEHTDYLRKRSWLTGFNILAVVDGNMAVQGRQVMGRPVLAPDDDVLRGQTILISSYGSQEAIVASLRRRFGSDIAIQTIYPNRELSGSVPARAGTAS